MMANLVFKNVFFLFFMFLVIESKEIDKEQVDKVIEDEITQKLSEDLLQSIEKKFNVDLEKSVDSVLTKIKVLLQNGTTHIQERLAELQNSLKALREDSEGEVDLCLTEYQNETTALAEKALHQMVVCGYALIGHDPAQAISHVMELKTMIKVGLKPIYEKREEVHNLLRVCGHDHDSLKKVIKCVISKSPQLKSAMMGVSGKLIDGVVHLTKQMAHGAMHEACLIEVINTVEEEAFAIVDKVRQCSFAYSAKNSTKVQLELEKLLKEDNATVLDIKRVKGGKGTDDGGKTDKANNFELKSALQKIANDSKTEATASLLKGLDGDSNAIANENKISDK